ncbi:hypothetical protein M404DRAFT_992427 [Pisolithus tinctorius Marx 270]|uniref:Uncharacterized protein n=1 Tax=Pisolithus tinctorius Marx 270 TaxID=870435 RepID=A0A0C3JYF5_PISTI|nr:hypothetical protein M404DRAFT_992427 [Pisolithus tinctorius Marx 270]
MARTRRRDEITQHAQILAGRGNRDPPTRRVVMRCYPEVLSCSDRDDTAGIFRAKFLLFSRTT